MRVDSFVRTLIFALLAAVGCSPWMLATTPLLSARWALGLYLAGVLVAYAAGLPGDLRRGARLALGAAVGAAVLLAIAPSLSLAVAGGVGILAVCRSVFTYRARALRSVAVEALLIGGGLALAAYMPRSGLLGASAGLWGFFLVQSFYFLIGPPRPVSASSPRDPFAEARARALRLLEELESSSR